MERLVEVANSMQHELVAWRRHLHQIPEVGLELPLTLAFVKAKLEELGYQPQVVAGVGISAIAGGKRPGKCILLRADMDALPMAEQTELPFAATNGCMHACGHDMHTAMLLGAAKLLRDREDDLAGSVKLMFQPAEEVFQGAQAMIRGGIMENPPVDAAVMFHVFSGDSGTQALIMPTGTIFVPTGGVLTTGGDWFEIMIRGRGGHGAAPEHTIDPLNVAAHINLGLQSLKSREISGAHNTVVTIGMVEGGMAGNIMPDTALMKGSIRTYDEEVRQFIHQRIEEIAHHIAKAFRAQAQVTFTVGCPSLEIDGAFADSVRRALQGALGDGVPNPQDAPVTRLTGSEDFAYIGQRVPAVMNILVAGNPEEGYSYPIHHPKVRFDERVLCRGAAAYAIAAMGWLADNP